MHRVDLHGRRCRLFTNDSRIPKLDVAGSIPVSRSMFSVVCRHSWYCSKQRSNPRWTSLQLVANSMFWANECQRFAILLLLLLQCSDQDPAIKYLPNPFAQA